MSGLALGIKVFCDSNVPFVFAGQCRIDEGLYMYWKRAMLSKILARPPEVANNKPRKAVAKGEVMPKPLHVRTVVTFRQWFWWYCKL